jgi:phosphohistidine phosphatase
MRVYFLRHGKSVDAAVWRADDRLRPLTQEGIDLMRHEAAALRPLGLVPDVLVTSPLTRARQTAEIVARELAMELIEDERLAPGFDRDALAAIMDDHAEAEALMVVGHEPDFSATIAKLIGGGRIDVKKGGLARVDVVERVGAMVFGVLVALLTPSLLGKE